MRKLTAFIAFVLLVIGSTSDAGAMLVSRDLFAPGDGNITFDSNTGLQWLDLPLTANLSYGGILSGMGGWTSLGFRYASANEVGTLFAHAGLSEHGVGNYGEVPQALNLINLLGSTIQNYAIGLTGEPAAAGCHYSAYVSWGASDTTAVVAKSVAINDGMSSNERGNFLVREAATVPIAPTHFLVLGGMSLLMLMRRRRGRAICGRRWKMMSDCGHRRIVFYP